MLKYFVWQLSRALSIQHKIPEISIRNQMERTILVRSDRNICDHLWRWSTSTGPHIRSPKCPFSLDLIIVPSTALLHRDYKNNNQTRAGLGRVCATGMFRSIWHVEFPRLQTRIFVERKAPLDSVTMWEMKLT